MIPITIEWENDISGRDRHTKRRISRPENDIGIIAALVCEYMRGNRQSKRLHMVLIGACLLKSSIVETDFQGLEVLELGKRQWQSIDISL